MSLKTWVARKAVLKQAQIYFPASKANALRLQQEALFQAILTG